MKKSTKKRLIRKARKITRHQSLKRAGIIILSSLALFYFLYQLVSVVGIFKAA
ncbi:MAG TPA: hypothetical protein VMR18_00170 [Candidatus Saccharimonadales bacterium]|nr:hypothetical protein [Candidatus Saccharimonadales bacterium]